MKCSYVAAVVAVAVVVAPAAPVASPANYVAMMGIVDCIPKPPY